MQRRITIEGVLEFIVLGVVLFAIVWRGGKSLDTVWIVTILASALTLLIPLLRMHNRSSSVVPSVWWICIGFVSVTILSFIFSLTRNYGLDEVFTTTALVLLLFWSVAWISIRPAFPSRLLKTVSFALLLACALGILVYLLQPVSRFVGTFFDYRFHTDYWPNAWAEFVLLAWPMLVWSLFVRPGATKHGSLFIKSLVLGCVLGCLLLSFSRGGFIALLMQLLILFLLSWRLWNRAFWRRTAFVLVTSIVVSFVVFTGINHVRARFHAVESVARKVTFSSDEGTSSVSERAQFWHQAITLTRQHPFLGWGPYSFRFVQPHVESGVLATSDHPHNVFLKLLMERGIFAPILFLLLLAYVLFIGTRSSLSLGNTEHAGMDRLLVVAILGVLAHNLIDYNLQFMGIAVVLWLSFGIIVSRSKSGRSARFRHWMELLVAMLLIVVVVREGVLLFYSSKARHEEAAGNYQSALSWYALTDSALFPRDQWLARSVILLSLGKVDDARKAAELSRMQNAEDARVWRLLGDIALRANKMEDARVAYARAFAFGRYNDIGITRGFVYVTTRGGIRLEEGMRKEVDALLNAFGEAMMQNLHFIALSTNVEDLASLTTLMGQLYPGDRGVYRALSDEVTAHAADVRSELSSRTRGLLW